MVLSSADAHLRNAALDKRSDGQPLSAGAAQSVARLFISEFNY